MIFWHVTARKAKCVNNTIYDDWIPFICSCLTVWYCPCWLTITWTRPTWKHQSSCWHFYLTCFSNYGNQNVVLKMAPSVWTMEKMETVWNMNMPAYINTSCVNVGWGLSWELEDSCLSGSHGSRRCRPGFSSQLSLQDTGLDLAVQALDEHTQTTRSEFTPDCTHTPFHSVLQLQFLSAET